MHARMVAGYMKQPIKLAATMFEYVGE